MRLCGENVDLDVRRVKELLYLEEVKYIEEEMLVNKNLINKSYRVGGK